MKRLKKILKWAAIVLLTIIAVLSVVVAARQNLKFDAPYPKITTTKDSAVIARGKHLVFSIAHCADCHSSQNTDSLLALGIEPSLSGGYKFDLPIATIYTRNITPDKETGIGNLSDAELARTLYYGVGSDGRAIFDFMPFHNISESDMQAILSYIRTQPPVHNKIPENDYTVLGRAIKAFLIKPTGPTGAIPKTISPDTTAAYGAYMVNSLGNCSGCHTKRDMMTGAYIGEHLAGGNEFDEKGFKYITPNLTPDSSGRIFSWTFENFKARFRLGKVDKNSPMPWNSYKQMTDDELKAIFNYLKSVKPAKTKF